MAVTFQAVGTAVSATTGTLTVAWPAHVANDVALLWVTSSGGGTTETLATANGFTLITTQVTGTGTAGTKLSVYWARATSSAMAAPVVTAGADFKYGVITTYRGAMTGVSPINVSAGAVKATASTSATMPAVTTLDPSCLVVLGISSDVDAATAFLTSTTNANLTGLTERFDAGTVSGLGGGIAVVDGTKATAGSTSTTAAVVVSSINAMITVALTPARTGTSTATIKLAASGVGAKAPTLPVSDTFTGTNGAAWDSAKWAQIDGAAPQIQSNRGQTTTGSATMLVSGMPTVTDVDAAITFRFVGAAGSSFRGFTFSVGGNTTYTGYTTDLYWDASVADMWMGFFSEDSTVSWETTAPGFVVDTDYTVRVKRYAGTVYFKWWASAGAEPSSWTYSAPEVTPAPSGKVAVYLGADGATFPVAVDNLSVVEAVAELETKTGSGTATIKLAASGVPVKRVDGTRTAALVLSASRTANSTRTGAATATLKLAATRTAAGVHNGTSTGTVKLAATGAGTKTATGTRTATVRLFASGTPAPTRTGTRAATLRLTAEGISGDKVGQASATIRLLASSTQTSVRTGAATATLKLTATRTAAPVRAGTRTATLKLASTGTGVRTHAATGTATLRLGLTVTTSLQKTSTATGTMWLASSYTASSIRTNLAAAVLLLLASGVGVKFLTQTNITVTAQLLPRRWDSELTPRDNHGALIERDNTGTLLERTNTGTLTPRRWEAELD